MIGKVIKVGNLYAVTVPDELVKSMGITGPQSVEAKVDILNQEIIYYLRPNKQVHKVAKWLLKRYLPAFKNLETK